jgi:signal transduction histidine kinase
MNKPEIAEKSAQVTGGHAAGMLHRFRFLFYTGTALSILIVVVLGIISYISLSEEASHKPVTELQINFFGHTRSVITIGTSLVLLIVAFLIYVVLNELSTRVRAYQQEHELNMLKSNFITMATHEFRTPLSSVILSAALIEKYAQKQDMANIVKHSLKVRQAVERLECILDDFSLLESLNSGKVESCVTTFDLDRLCCAILEEACRVASPYQHLSYKFTGGQPIVSIDRDMLRKVITKLLTNAIKFAGEGAEISLHTDVTEKRIAISVKDNGPGIEAKDQQHLFGIFYKVSDSGNIPGTGLGLYIVKRYMDLMGGKLQFNSTPHQETCFDLTFPIVTIA